MIGSTRTEQKKLMGSGAEQTKPEFHDYSAGSKQGAIKESSAVRNSVTLERGRATNRILSVSGVDPARGQLTDLLIEALQRRWIDTPAISELDGATPKERLATADAAIADLNKGTSMVEANMRRRTHPLHMARVNRLGRYHEQAWTERDAAAAAVTPSVKKKVTDRRPSLPKIRHADGPDFDLDL